MRRKQYSIYEAKARFSEILRIVRQRRRVIITDRGAPVAEIIPYRSPEHESVESRLAKLVQIGAVVPSQEPFKTAPVRIITGASSRFLARDRD